MTPYEILKGRKPNLKYFHVFGCVCYVLNDRDQLSKFDARSDKEMFLGYASNSRAYRVYNLKTRTIQVSMYIVLDDASGLLEKAEDDDLSTLIEEMSSTKTDTSDRGNQNIGSTSETTLSPPPLSVRVCILKACFWYRRYFP